MTPSFMEHDPYEDYNPEQYLNNNTDDEDEDDVVYMDVNSSTNSQCTSSGGGAASNPSIPAWKWTQNDPSQDLSQRTNATLTDVEGKSSTKKKQQQQQAPSNIVPRRDRKRRKRLEQLFVNDDANTNDETNHESGKSVERTSIAVPSPQHTSNNSSIGRQSSNDDTNIFASLLSELEKKDESSSTDKHDNEDCQYADENDVPSQESIQQDNAHPTIDVTEDQKSTGHTDSIVEKDSTMEQAIEDNSGGGNGSSPSQPTAALQTASSSSLPQTAHQQKNESSSFHNRLSKVTTEHSGRSNSNRSEHEHDTVNEGQGYIYLGEKQSARPAHRHSSFQKYSNGFLVDDDYESSVGSKMEYQLQRQQKLRRQNQSMSQSRVRQKKPWDGSFVESMTPEFEGRGNGSMIERQLAKNRKKVNSSVFSSAVNTSSQGQHAFSSKSNTTLLGKKKSHGSSFGKLSPTPITFETSLRRFTKESSPSLALSFHSQTQKSRKSSSALQSKSIVGSRPQHWGNSDPHRQKRRSNGSLSQATAKLPSFGTESSVKNKTSRAAQLAEATKKSIKGHNRSAAGISFSFGSPRPAAKKGQRPNNLNAATAKTVLNSPCNNERRSPDRRSQVPRPGIENDGARQTEIENHQKTNSNLVTFTPAFLASRKKRNEDTIEDAGFTQFSQCAADANTSQAPITPFHAGTSPLGNADLSPGSTGGTYRKRRTRTSSRRKKGGKLVQKLRSIRGSIEGDLVRFQSGMYPFHRSRRHDINDPRNRAESYMDVTIIGDPVSWECGNQRVTVLGFIHDHVKLKGKGTTDQSRRNDCNCLAWMCFTYDTTRQQKIKVGTQLRIYNAIIMETQRIAQSENLEGGIRENSSKKLVLCSTLCEAYPATLPPLPTVPKVTSKN